MPEYTKEEYWSFLHQLQGRWIGQISGKAGLGKGKQCFSQILDKKYLHSRSKAIFEPQEANPEGEIHEDWAFFSYDSFTNEGKLRVFYSEGYISAYTLAKLSSSDQELVFLTAENENLPEGFRAKLTLKLLSEEKLLEKLELAGPGQDFGMCIEIQWTKAPVDDT